MKQISPAFLLVCLFVLTTFFSCKKMKDGRLTFFVSNAGDAGKWGSITVKVGELSKHFSTPERRIWVLVNEAQMIMPLLFIYLPVLILTQLMMAIGVER